MALQLHIQHLLARTFECNSWPLRRPPSASCGLLDLLFVGSAPVYHNNKSVCFDTRKTCKIHNQQTLLDGSLDFQPSQEPFFGNVTVIVTA